MKAITQYSTQIQRARTEVTDRMYRLLYDADEALELTFNNPEFLAMILDENGTIIRASESWRDFLGYRPGEMSGRHFTDFMVPDKTSIPLFKKGIQHGTNVATDYVNEYRAKNGKHKKVIWLYSRADGKFRYTVAKPFET